MSGWTERRRRAAARREAARWFARNRSADAPRHAREFEAWRAADPAHAEAYARMEGHFAASAAVTHRPASPARPALGLAAAVVAAVVGLATLVLSDSTTRTDVGELRAITLADGSRVVLDTATVLETAYDETERRLHLRSGRARFDVAHGDRRPFLVDAGGLEVQATGTRFDVRLSGTRAEVVLLDGQVELRTAAIRRQLLPGQAVAVVPGRLEARPADLAAAVAWPSGRLVFTDTPLLEVVAEANRYAERPITLADPALGRAQVTASFTATDTPTIARTLAVSLRLRLSDDGREFRLQAPSHPARSEVSR